MCLSNDTAWVELTGSAQHRAGDLFVHNTGRLRHLVQRLPDPRKTVPQIILCLGNQDKRRFLQTLCSDFRRQPGLAHLYLARGTLAQAKFRLSAGDGGMILAADVQPYAKASTREHVHKTTCGSARIHYSRGACTISSANAQIITSLLLPFSDLVVLFVDDFGGFSSACNMLIGWMQHVAAGSRSPYPIKSSLIMLHSTLISRAADDNAALDALMYRNTELNAFSEIRISPRSEQWAAIEHALSAIRTEKQRHLLDFPAHELNWYFERAVIELGRSTSPFDFVVASRYMRPVAQDYSRRLGNLFRLGQYAGVSLLAVSETVVLSLILDAFMPGSRVFTPESMFDAIYAPVIRGLLQDIQSEIGNSAACFHSIRSKMCLYVAEYAPNHGDDWAKRCYLDKIDRTRDPADAYFMNWTKLKSNICCLICLARDPRLRLECGHAICEVCVRRFGHSNQDEEFSFSFPSCVLCCASSLARIALKPPTAAARVLSIDGGGTRGIGPLKELDLLERGLGFPVYCLFDLVIGTSVGGLIALGVFARCWSASDFLGLFQRFAREVFAHSGVQRTSIATAVWSCWKVMFTDDCVGRDNLERALTACLGCAEPLFGCQAALPGYHCRVGVTTRSNGSNYVLTNYHGPREDGSDGLGPSYTRISPKDDAEALLLWQAAAATAALPSWVLLADLSSAALTARSMFPPVRYDGKDHYDGGLGFVNPVEIAREESDLLWTDSFAADLVLSLGTGYVKGPTPQCLADSGLRKRVQPYMSAASTYFDAHRTHRMFARALNSTESSVTYHRLDVPFRDSLPRMDDLRAMDSMIDMVASPARDPERSAVQLSLIASCFFFEMTSYPDLQSRDGTIACKGAIRIRGPVSDILTWLERNSPGTVYFTSRDPRSRSEYSGPQHSHLATCVPRRKVCPTCGRFNLPVRLTMREEDVVGIWICLSDGKHCKISGFPRKTSWFTKHHFLENPFLTAPWTDNSCTCRLGRFP